MSVSSAPGSEPQRYEVAALHRFTCGILRGFGLVPPDALTVADALLDADVTGTRTHGLALLPSYLRRLRAGAINPRPDVRVTGGSGAVLTFDGDDGFGQVVASRMLAELRTVARDQGVAVGAARHSNHLGALGYFVRLAAEDGFFAVLGQNTRDIVVPVGGMRAGIGNNPFAIALPGGSDGPIVLDIACSEVARHRVVSAARDGREIPQHWAVDENGQPTTDPAAALRGALQPFGGHKGFGLAVVVGALSSVLAGAAFGPAVPSVDDYGRPRDLGHFLLLLDVSRFGPLSDYERRIEDYVAQIRSAGDQVRMPGHGGQLRRAESHSNGVVVSPDLIETLIGIAAQAGVPVDRPAEVHL